MPSSATLTSSALPPSATSPGRTRSSARRTCSGFTMRAAVALISPEPSRSLPDMRVRVLLFAALREAVGQKQLDLELPADATLAELVAQLEREYSVLARYRGRLLVS